MRTIVAIGGWGMLGALLVPAGCFPYRQHYRAALEGVVIDAAGASHVAVIEACSPNGLGGEVARCPRRAVVVTDAAGRFSISSYSEFEWCCFGEAPRPRTTLFVCTADGERSVRSLVDGETAPLRIVTHAVADAATRSACRTLLRARPPP